MEPVSKGQVWSRGDIRAEVLSVDGDRIRAALHANGAAARVEVERCDWRALLVVLGIL